LKVKRRIRITVLRETFAAHGVAAADAGEAWCPACAAVSPVLDAEEAAAFCGVAGRPVFGGTEAGGVHFVEAGGLAPLVCLRSLLSAGAARGGAGVRGAAKVLNFRRDGESG
jgi:glycine/D-amino acid oxidase-like deaminating enzyme